jgi:site-specific DNA-methyltransferase (adenine-specific)
MLYNESCIEGSKKHLVDNSVDLLIADPPYNLRFGGTTQTKTKIIKNCIVWDKEHIGLGWQYRYLHEFIIFAVKEDKRVRRISTRKQTDIWRIPRIHGNKTIHPTEKPLELLKEMIVNSSEPGELLVDYFAGSGVVEEAAIRLQSHKWIVTKHIS